MPCVCRESQCAAPLCESLGGAALNASNPLSLLPTAQGNLQYRTDPDASGAIACPKAPAELMLLANLQPAVQPLVP